jgi:peptidoglycan biosynthesis protein MviN/MurJ (putative lipid II flippase)
MYTAYLWPVLLTFSLVFLYLTLVHSFYWRVSRYWKFLGVLTLWLGMALGLVILIGGLYLFGIPYDAVIPVASTFQWWYLLVLLGPSFIFLAFESYQENQKQRTIEDEDYES